MLSKGTMFVVVFLFMLFSSPWFLILIQNYPLIKVGKDDLLFSKNQVFLDQTNVLRGQTLKSGNRVIGRLFVNKFTTYGREMTKRYLESFDSNFLFFTGGIDKITSTGNTGQLPLSFLPLIIYSIFIIYFSKKNKYRIKILLLFILSPIFSAFFYKHYEWLPKVIFFLIGTLMASYGLTKVPKSKKVLIILFLIFWIYETVSIYHKLKNHYTENLAEQIYNIKK